MESLSAYIPSDIKENFATKDTANNDSNGIQTHSHLVWLNSWVFVYEISGCAFESRWCHLNFRYSACFEQGVPWHSGKI